MKEPELSEMLYWIEERESIRKKKDGHLPKPWTEDPILRDYKFCNVFREDDRVTAWIFDRWLHVYDDSPHLAFAMCVARHFNWPETLEAIEPWVFGEWKPEEVRAALKARRDAGHKIYTGAYTVSTCGRAMDKIDYSIDLVLTPLRTKIRNPLEGEKCEEYWNYLQQFEGFSSFMAGQVVADLKFQEPLYFAADTHDWAPLGPGSIRGLNRLFGRPVSGTIRQAQGLNELRDIQKIIHRQLKLPLQLHNVQNCMCEFDKYMRLKYDGGKVRSKYPGRA